MQKQKKLSVKILSIALSAAMVLTMMPATVFAAEGDTAPKPEDMTFAAPVAAAAGNRYEAITIAQGSLNGNTVWGVTENRQGPPPIMLDNSALFYAKMDSRNGGTGGLPIDGNLKTPQGVPYKFASGSDPATAYDGNDAIHLTAGKTSQTMDLQTIGAYEKIYVLATAGGPGTGNYAQFQVTLTYTDDSESTTQYKLYDWFDTTTVKNVEQVKGLWRFDAQSNKFHEENGKPIMHSATIAADSGKLLKSISFEMVKQGGNKETTDMSNLYCGIYAVTGAVSAKAPAQPTALPATNVNSGTQSPGFTANWTKVDDAIDYRLDISERENFTTLVGAYNNMSVPGTENPDGTMSFDVTGLTSNTTYYYRVRATNSFGQSLSSIRMATDLPQWVKKAGLNSTNATYDVETGTLKLSEGAILTGPLVIPADGARTLDLNGQTLTAAHGQPVIQATDGGKVELTLKDSTSTSGKSPTLVGGDGQPAIDFSSAAAGSKVTLSDGASVKGGDGGIAGSNGGDGITGNAGTEIVMGNGSAATGGSGGAGGNGGNGVTGGIVIIDGNATGGTGGENTEGKGGDGGIGASGNTINGSGTATGGNGGGGSTTNGSGGKGTSTNPEFGSTLNVNNGVEGILKDKIVITGLKAPDSNKVYDGNPIENTVFGTATFDKAWSGTLEYTYYSGSTATGTPLASNPTNAGNYTVVAAIPATDVTYSGKHAAITFTIDAKTVTVTDGALEVKKPYDGTTDAGIATGKLGLIGVETADATNVSVKIDTIDAYADSNMGKNKTVTLTISLAGTAASNYTLDSATYSFAKAEITKATYTGTPASAPDSTPENKGDKSITIKSVTPPDGETVEYAVSENNTAPTLDSDWQTSTTFDKLDPNTEYFFFARVTESDNHAPGGESSPGTSITTDKSEYPGKSTKPDGTPDSRSDTSITLKKVTPPDGETLEYGIDKDNDGNIKWQDSRIFDSLSLNTKYKFYTRVKENNTHKVGTASDATIIRTKKAPANVSGNVKDSNGGVVGSATVTLKQSDPLITVTTDSNGNYSFKNVPEGVYNLVVTTGTGADQIIITETVIVAGEPVVVKDMQFLNGKKNTVVESGPNTPGVAVGGMNELLNDSNLNTTLSEEEKTAVNGNGSVELKFTANLKEPSEVAADKSDIEGIANGQNIDLLLDLSVLKTVKSSSGGIVADSKKVTTLAKIIEIHLPIPANLQGKDGLRLYRMHGGKAQLLSTSADANGEYYTIDPSGEFMTAYVKNFSTYAMGYNATTVIIPGGGGGGSSSSNYYYIKATAGPGGSMSTAERVKVRAGESASFTITPDKGYQIDDVLVNGKSIGAKNTYVFTNVYSDQTIYATFKKVGDNNPQIGVSFEDVKENDWCYDAIMKATANGWVNGTSEKTFSPNDPTSRGMIAVILHRMDGTPKANAASFNDVMADAYYANGVAWAETNNIVRGYGNGSYGPNVNITREQFASILYRYASHKGYDVSKIATLDSFADSESVSGDAKEAMSWAVGSGLIFGRDNNALAPTATATRAEVAVILVRFDELFIK